MSKVMVSISCTTYNHEKYISDAIESFLMQKTNFNFEILIHDDASTDRTTEIIREYEKKYPEKIKPIYQIENQYSKGVKITPFLLERTRGKYIAICEGDDYWIDPYKLQKQVDYMEKHPDCSLCVHSGIIVPASQKDSNLYKRPYKENKDITLEEIIEAGGDLFITNSMLYPTKFGLVRPDFLERASVGDYPLAINLALQGKVYYMDDFMSAYRSGVNGSWTEREYSDINRRAKHINEMVKMLDEINNYTNYLYEGIITKTKLLYKFNLLLGQRKLKEAVTGETKDIYLKLGFKSKINIVMNQYFPHFLKIVHIAKRKLIK